MKKYIGSEISISYFHFKLDISSHAWLVSCIYLLVRFGLRHMGGRSSLSQKRKKRKRKKEKKRRSEKERKSGADWCLLHIRASPRPCISETFMGARYLSDPEKHGNSDLPSLCRWDHSCKHRKSSHPRFRLALVIKLHSSVMYSRTLSLPFILLTVNSITRADLGLSTLDDEPLTFLAPDEQVFDNTIPLEDFDTDTDLFSTNDCSDAADIFDPFWDQSLQARGTTCPNAPPETENSAGDEKTNNPGEGGNSPSSEKLNPDLYDNSVKPDTEPLRRVFSLPKDYQDERCKEYEYVRYAVCSSGDYRDEARSMAYSFYPLEAYRLRKCTFGEFWISPPRRNSSPLKPAKCSFSCSPFCDSVKVLFSRSKYSPPPLWP